MKLRKCLIVVNGNSLNCDINEIVRRNAMIKKWLYIFHDKDATRPHYHIYLNFGKSSVASAGMENMPLPYFTLTQGSTSSLTKYRGTSGRFFVASSIFFALTANSPLPTDSDANVSIDVTMGLFLSISAFLSILSAHTKLTDNTRAVSIKNLCMFLLINNCLPSLRSKPEDVHTLGKFQEPSRPQRCVRSCGIPTPSHSTS